MAPHSSTLAWKIPWTEEPGRLQSMGSHRVGHDWSDLAAAWLPSFMGWDSGKESACQCRDMGSIPGLGRSPGVGNGTPLQCSCLENSMDRGALRAHSPWGCKELDMTERLNWTELSMQPCKHLMAQLYSISQHNLVPWMTAGTPKRPGHPSCCDLGGLFPSDLLHCWGRGEALVLTRGQEGTNQCARQEALLSFQWLIPLLLSRQQKRF